MESWIRGIFLSALSLTWALPWVCAQAADLDNTGTDAVFQPAVERADFSLANIDAQDFEISLYSGILSVEDFGTNNVIGGRLGYHVTERFFLEGTYGKSEPGKTSYEQLSGASVLLTDEDRKLNYYNVLVAFDLFPGEAFLTSRWAFNSAVYVVGGVGSTDFGGDDRFTTTYGAGFRFVATDWFVMRFDVRDHLYRIDLIGPEKTAHNIELVASFGVYF